MSSFITKRGPAAPSCTAPWAPLSLDPKVSSTITPGSCCFSSSLTVLDNMAPPEPTTTRLEVS